MRGLFAKHLGLRRLVDGGSVSDIPATAILFEDGTAMLAEDGSFLLEE